MGRLLLRCPMPIVLNVLLDRHSDLVPSDRLSLTAEERQRSRYPFITAEGMEVYVELNRGTCLRGGDRLQSVDGSVVVEVVARPEWVMAVTAEHGTHLLQAAYHLGNRHVSLEITATHLYLLPDPVLQGLLEQRGLRVEELERPFQPELGAYEQPHHHH
jgi:urease accessory protein